MGKLTDNDLTRINGNRERMLGGLQERYGWEKRAEDELKRFEDSYRREGESQFDRNQEGKNWREGHEGRQWKDEDQESGHGKSKKRKIG